MNLACEVDFIFKEVKDPRLCVNERRVSDQRTGPLTFEKRTVFGVESPDRTNYEGKGSATGVLPFFEGQNWVSQFQAKSWRRLGPFLDQNAGES